MVLAAVIKLLLLNTYLPNSLIDIKIKFSSNIESKSIIAASLVLNGHKWDSNWMTLLNRVRDFVWPGIFRQVHKFVASFLRDKTLFYFSHSPFGSRHLCYPQPVVNMSYGNFARTDFVPCRIAHALTATINTAVDPLTVIFRVSKNSLNKYGDVVQKTYDMMSLRPEKSNMFFDLFTLEFPETGELWNILPISQKCFVDFQLKK